jgi:hypothetical protein
MSWAEDRNGPPFSALGLMRIRSPRAILLASAGTPVPVCTRVGVARSALLLELYGYLPYNAAEGRH